jgi:hypothetical protein
LWIRSPIGELSLRLAKPAGGKRACLRRTGLDSGAFQSDNGANEAWSLQGGLPHEKGEWSMKRFQRSWTLAVILMVALACAITPRAAAQNDSSIRGQILDINGKPWADIGIQVVSDQGSKYDTKTDKNGYYSIRNIRSGIYTVYVQLPPPNQPFPTPVRVAGGSEAVVDLNFKDIAAKQGAEYQEAANLPT